VEVLRSGKSLYQCIIWSGGLEKNLENFPESGIESGNLVSTNDKGGYLISMSIKVQTQRLRQSNQTPSP